MIKTVLASIFISRLRKIPKAKQSLKNKPPDKQPHRKYRSPLDQWRAIIKSVLSQQRLIRGHKRSKDPICGSMGCLANLTSSKSFQTSPISKYKSKLDKCGNRGRRATIMALFPTTGRSVFMLSADLMLNPKAISVRE